jgi:hypothetical protein
MRVSEPILFRAKSKPQKLFLLVMVGFEDDGMRMRSPLGFPAERLVLGETLIDPDGKHYIIKKMSLHSDVIWLEKIIEDENIAS